MASSKLVERGFGSKTKRSGRKAKSKCNGSKANSASLKAKEPDQNKVCAAESPGRFGRAEWPKEFYDPNCKIYLYPSLDYPSHLVYA